MEDIASTPQTHARSKSEFDDMALTVTGRRRSYYILKRTPPVLPELRLVSPVQQHIDMARALVESPRSRVALRKPVKRARGKVTKKKATVCKGCKKRKPLKKKKSIKKHSAYKR